VVPIGLVRQSVDTDAGLIALWRREGKEPGLFLIHGNTSSKAAFRDLLLEPALASRTIVALDLPGCGESDRASDDHYTIPALARVLAPVIQATFAQGPVIVGWSLGGHIALEALGQNPDICRALVLTGTPPAGPGAEELTTTFHMNDLTIVATAESPSDEQLDVYVRALYGDSKPIPAELFAAARRCHGRLRSVCTEHMLRGEEGHPQRRVIAQWPHPIATLQGDRDVFFDPALLDRLSWKNLWRGATQYVHGTGHAPFFERPEGYAALLGAFLREIETGQRSG
jgi:pimeloyl-ACP methyl ester carboxylesterase